MTSKNEKKPLVDADIVIEDIRLGVWTLKLAKPSGMNLQKYWDDIRSAYPLLRRLCGDIYSLAPRLFIFYIICQMWSGVEEALLMHFSSSLLRTIEAGILTGRPDFTGILSASIGRLLCSVLVAYLAWHGQASLNILSSRIKNFFDIYLMQGEPLASSEYHSSSEHSRVTPANLRVDLPTSQGEGGEQAGAASQIALIAHLSRTTGGPFFALLCVTKPLFSAFFSRMLWDKVCFGYVDNQHHTRMKALEQLASDTYRQDIISSNLGEWIMKQYQTSYEELGQVTDDHPYSQYSRRSSSFFDVASKLLGDLPMVYCAAMAIINPTKFSVASIAILQQSSSHLRYSLETIFQSSEQFRQNMSSIRKVYAASSVTNTMSDGHLSYPSQNEKNECKTEKGMSFELKNVSFSYPGSQKTTTALNNISMKINAGQLIVIVGANGSGKSTMVRILSRLYDPTSGQVLIDGHPSRDYRVGDLHQATAILSQDNHLFPLSLAENIGLGYPPYSSNIEMVAEAAKEGGAAEFMEKLKNGMDTVLEPYIDSFSLNLYGNKTHPLYQEMEQIQKKIDISGGERQRIVAARTFMRFKSGKVKFVAVDEPSSALDAEGELQLFERLIGVRGGKTMVFVTHRFGHLTRHADQIICMKDGSIVETGTHDELMQIKGEYAKLYDIQASAFVVKS
ncbi:P-loop containing nucleoside triphosphate hydrolase protein [Crassisporium funariophilum]|nr:P-loop containing nucleoside triphosphate hydrolase protein [Crassisporium funariophilum]